jgi:hypothetical protein
MAQHKIGTQEEWQASRDELLKEEKELTRRDGSRPSSAQRPSPISSTAAPSSSSTTSCSGRPMRQAARSDEAGCPVCSSIADTLAPRVVHLQARDATLLLAFLHTEEELRPFLEGEIPVAVEENARSCGTGVLEYVSEGPGLSV